MAASNRVLLVVVNGHYNEIFLVQFQVIEHTFSFTRLEKIQHMHDRGTNKDYSIFAFLQLWKELNNVIPPKFYTLIVQPFVWLSQNQIITTCTAVLN